MSACTSVQEPPKPIDRENCSQLKDLDIAITACGAAIAAAPRDAHLRVNRGFAFFLQKKYDQALADFEEAIGLNPKDPDAFARRGLIFRFKGDDDRAIADFTHAISLGFSDPNVFVDRGTAYLAKGDNPTAIADYTTAIERDSGRTFVSHLAHVVRGIAWLYSGSPDKARLDFARAVEFNPSEPFFALFLHLAERRTGSTSSLASATKKLDMTKWPAPAIRMFLGEETPENVLAVNGAAVTVCEAIYFAAEFMFIEDRKEEALRLYRQAASECPRYILEGVAASAALRSLGATP